MNRKLGVQLMLFITMFLFISSITTSIVYSAPTIPITQNTLIVDQTGKGDFTTIRDAINSAGATDIIEIRKGIYLENNLVINKKIQLVGESPSNTIIDCSGNLAFTISTPYVDISNLQIINTEEYAISILPGSVGCTITNCIINTNFKGVAIDVRSSYNTVSDCTLKGLENSKQGVKIHGSYNIVKNCEIQDFSNGILIIKDSNNNQIQNCNIINNQNAIDIRDNSNNNIVTGCNIFSNLQSIRIWQNSNYNQIYLNNFWKNDVDAVDENNNSWDDGNHGNYWDKYRGVDEDGDGIGDTPYTISSGKVDNYPLMSMIEPDIINAPGNVIITSSKSINKPSFTWSPSIYSRE
jgi:parallel beta-helix repeat protein